MSLSKANCQGNSKCHKILFKNAAVPTERLDLEVFWTLFVDCSAFKREICINPLITVCLQPASSSDSEGNNDGGGSDEDDNEEEAAVPQKVDSGSEVDSDSGSEDQGRGGGVKRKPPPVKVTDI